MYGNAATVSHHNLFNILQVGNHTFRTDIIGTVHLFYIATSGILVVTAQSLEHIPDGDVERIQCIRVNRNLILFQVPSETVDLHNARNTRKLTFHNPVLNSTQLHGIVLLFISRSYFQHILINFSQTGGNRHHFRYAEIGRNLPGHGLYLFIDQLTGIQRRHAFLEYYRHYGKSKTRHRTDFLHIHNVAHGNLYRERNQLLYLLRSQSRRYRDYLHLIIGNIRYGINRQRQHRINAPNH